MLTHFLLPNMCLTSFACRGVAPNAKLTFFDIDGEKDGSLAFPSSYFEECDCVPGTATSIYELQYNEV